MSLVYSSLKSWRKPRTRGRTLIDADLCTRPYYINCLGLRRCKQQIKDYSRCLTAEMRTVLSPSGAYVCPYHRGNSNLKIGDPNTESLKDIWYGKTRKEIMEKKH